MLLLAVETASPRQSVALLKGETVLARSDEEARGSHARKLLPAIDRLLAGQHLGLRDLEGLAVSIGPGSFTGLRVGLATLLAFRSVTGVPLAAVPTLEGMAWNVRGENGVICPMLKARTGELYWGLFRWQAGVLERLAEDRVGSPRLAAESLHGPTLAVGDGWDSYGPEIVASLAPGASVRSAPAGAMAASAVSVGLAGLSLLARGEQAGPSLSPRYIQQAEAELNASKVSAARRPAVAGRTGR